MPTPKKPLTKTLKKSLETRLRHLSKTTSPWKTLSANLSHSYQSKYRSNARKVAGLQRGWQQSLERRAALKRHVATPAERAAAAKRRAERVKPEQRIAKILTGLQAFGRERFAGLLAMPKAKLWRKTAFALGAVAVISVAGNILMYYRFTPARPLVTIGHHVIRDREYRAQLDNAAGQPVLTRLVFSELIRQAAAKAGVTPTPAQIDARIADLQRHGQAPTQAGTPEFRDGLALDLALENLRVAGVSASDAEVADFYKQHAAALAQPAQVQSILVVTEHDYVAKIAANLLAKGKTAPEMAAQPDMKVDGENGFHINLSALPPAAHQAIVSTALGMHPGQITTMSLGNVFLTIKCLHSRPGSVPTLPQVKDQVVRLVKLQKAPSAAMEMAMLYKANKPDFDIDRYAAYFSEINNAQVPVPTAAPASKKTASLP